MQFGLWLQDRRWWLQLGLVQACAWTGTPASLGLRRLGGRRQRNLAFFSQWKPPDGFEFKGFWGFADGSGGVAIVETDSAATMAKATAPFTPWLRFNATPILQVEEAAAIAGEAAAARASFAG